jgi:hypothetical protein
MLQQALKESSWKAGESKYMPNTISNIYSKKSGRELLGIRHKNYLFGTKYCMAKSCLTLAKGQIILQAKTM